MRKHRTRCYLPSQIFLPDRTCSPFIGTRPAIESPEAVSVIGERYAAVIDFDGTGPIAERHGLSM